MVIAMTSFWDGLAVLELGQSSLHRGIAREFRVNDWPGHTAKRSDGPPALGNLD